MDYTLSNSYTPDPGSGNRMHEDAKAIPTVWSAKDANSVIWSLMEVIESAGLAGIQFDKAKPQSYQLLLKALRSNGLIYGIDTGVANAAVVNYTPAVDALADGMVLWFKAATANTGPTTLRVDGLGAGAAAVVGGANSPLQGGEIVANGRCQVVWNANLSAWVLIRCTGAALQVAPGWQGMHALSRDVGDARYAAMRGNSVPFAVGDSGTANSVNAVPRWQAEQLYATKAGANWQAFEVAQGQLNTQAVRLDQFNGSASTTGYIKIPMTQGGYRNLIINWGVAAAAANTVTAQWYAMAFPNGCFCAIGSRIVAGSNAVMNVGPFPDDPRARVAFQNYGSTQENVGYIAIGW